MTGKVGENAHRAADMLGCCAFGRGQPSRAERDDMRTTWLGSCSWQLAQARMLRPWDKAMAPPAAGMPGLPGTAAEPDWGPSPAGRSPARPGRAGTPGRGAIHSDRLIDPHPGQDGRPDDNPSGDLHDDAGQLHAPHGRGQDGRRDRDHADNQQPIEAHCAHRPQAFRSDNTVRYLLLSPHAGRYAVHEMTPGPGRRVPD